MQTPNHTDPKGPVPSADLIGKLPKTDVHVHLDGSLRLDTLIELARDARLELPSQTPEGLLELVFKETYDDLEDYLRAFSYTSPALCTAEALGTRRVRTRCRQPWPRACATSRSGWRPNSTPAPTSTRQASWRPWTAA